MKVLVTGGRGLLGSATVAALTAAGHDVTVLQRTASGTGVREMLGDIQDPDVVARAVKGQEAVLHGAARVSLVGDWDQFARTNVDGTRLVVEHARAAGVSRFIQVSSPSVAHAGTALVGASAEPASPGRARGNYARSKALAEEFVLTASGQHMSTCAIRPHLVWGPGDTQLVGRIIERARRNRLVLVGTGCALIDTTYVDNAASALVAAVERVHDPTVSGRAFVVTNGEPRTVRELVTRMAHAAGEPGPRAKVPLSVARAAGLAVERMWQTMARQDEPPMTSFLAEQLATAHWFDQRQTRRALEWAPQVSLDEGFTRLAAWLQGGAAVNS